MPKSPGKKPPGALGVASCDHQESREAMTLVLRMQEAQNRIEGLEPFDGEAKLDFPPSGVTWHLTCPGSNVLLSRDNTAAKQKSN
jgi:flagellar capping protein FliD